MFFCAYNPPLDKICFTSGTSIVCGTDSDLWETGEDTDGNFPCLIVDQTLLTMREFVYPRLQTQIVGSFLLLY